MRPAVIAGSQWQGANGKQRSGKHEVAKHYNGNDESSLYVIDCLTALTVIHDKTRLQNKIIEHCWTTAGRYNTVSHTISYDIMHAQGHRTRRIKIS